MAALARSRSLLGSCSDNAVTALGTAYLGSLFYLVAVMSHGTVCHDAELYLAPMAVDTAVALDTVMYVAAAVDPGNLGCAADLVTLDTLMSVSVKGYDIVMLVGPEDFDDVEALADRVELHTVISLAVVIHFGRPLPYCLELFLFLLLFADALAPAFRV